MKTLISIAFLLINLVSFSQTTNPFTDREDQMVSEINALRANPKSYIPKVEAYIKMCEKKIQMIANGKLKTTTDFNVEIAAAKELIEVLNNTPSLPQLVVNHDMYLVTKAHGEYLKTKNISSHTGANGELAPSRMSNINVNNVTENIVTDNGTISPTILVLLVDAGIDGRGHRNNLLNPNSKFISVYTNGDVWVQNFAN
jgi:uncharacterized protein YkwD